MNHGSRSGAGLLVLSARWPKHVLALWVLLTVACVAVIALKAGTAFSTEVQRDDDSGSTRAQSLMRERFPDRPESDPFNEILVLRSATLTVDDAPFREQAQAIADRLMALAGEPIAGGVSYFLTADPSLVSADRHTTIVPLQVRDPIRDIDRIRRAASSGTGSSDLQVHLVGRASVGMEFKTLAEQDLRAELKIGLPVAMLVLLVVFATAVAALLPLIVGLAAIAGALAIAVLAGPRVHAYFLVTNMIVMMGLAVGIDYSLFMLSRYREERARGLSSSDALAASGRTAGRAIVFSGATVVLALLGLLIIPTNIFRSLAAGAILAVAVSMLASFTLLPALIALLGDRLDAGRIPWPRFATGGATWAGAGRLVTRWPVASVLVCVALLSGLAVPALGMRTGFSGIESLPERAGARQGFQLLEREFRSGAISEAIVVIDGAANSAPVTAAIARLRVALAADRAFVPDKARLQVNAAGTLAVLTVPMTGDAESEATQAGVRRLRGEHIASVFKDVSAHVFVAGNAAGYIDFFRLTDRYTPIVFGFVLSLSFVLLTVAFRSLVVPLKAILLNLLSVAAAYGLMVLVFQQGVGAALFGFQRVALIEAWIPLFLFTILYGLSMDYHVFLLSRIRERFEATGSNDEAVAAGMRSTTGVITGAALIMVAIFAGFASGELVMFQQVGFGLAVAVLLDATLVRSVLVPAAMILLGEKNWYLPGWLAWLPRW